MICSNFTKNNTRLFVNLSIVSGIISIALSILSSISTKWSVTCFKIDDMITFGPTAPPAGTTQATNEPKVDRDVFRKKDAFCFDVGLYYYGFTSPNGIDHSHNSIKLGTLGMSFLSAILITSVAATFVSILFSTVHLVFTRKTNVYSERQHNTIHLNNAHMFAKVCAFVSTLFAVIYTYEQLVGTSKTSGCGSNLASNADLDDLSFHFNNSRHFRGAPKRDEAHVTTRQVMWWMKSMLNQAERQAGDDPGLRKKFLKLKFSTRPRFGTSYYLVLLCALCNFACLYFVTTATKKLPPDSYTVA